MCQCLEVSSNAYYSWKRNLKPDGYQSPVKKLKKAIKDIWENNFKIYGSHKITNELAKIGIRVCRSYVSRLMSQMGIASIVKRKFKSTTNSSHDLPLAGNLLNREFQTDKLGYKWVSDITYIRMGDKWLYLTTMIDLADRKMVGWSLSLDMTTENTVLRAWLHARRNRDIIDGFILHSDRGVQYAANKVRKIFSFNRKTQQSMSRKGNCWDNAVAESFFKTIKCEWLNRHKISSYQQAYSLIEQYILWYNTKRIHQSLGYKTPLEKERELRSSNHKKVA